MIAALILPPAVALATLCLHMVVNWLLVPAPLQRSPQRVALIVSAVSAAAFTAVSAALEGVTTVPFVAVVSSCITYCYFHLFNMSETARRIRILTTTYLGTPTADLQYPLEAMIDARIDRLIMLGALAEWNGCFRPLPGPLLVAAIVIDRWRSVLFPARHTGADGSPIDPSSGATT